MRKLFDKLLFRLGYIPVRLPLIIEKREFEIQLIKGVRLVHYMTLARSNNATQVLDIEAAGLMKEILEKAGLFVDLKITDNLTLDCKEINAQLYVASKKIKQ